MKGEVALVTGASGGIGRAVALELGRRGAQVAVHFHQDEVGALEVVAALHALSVASVAVRGDLRTDEGAKQLVEQVRAALGPVRRLVCGAALHHAEVATFMAVEDWDRVMDLNLRGAFLTCQAALPGMFRAGGGSVVFIGSATAQHGGPGMAAYAASKAGLEGLARALALEVAPRNVRVNVVAPGLVETRMTGEVPAAHLEEIRLRTPLGRAGQPEEIARAVAFLLSEDASFITGAVLPVNGGLPLGWTR